jgi:acyl-CoA hydrolase
VEYDLTPKRAAESEVELVQVMELADANLSGNVHGGVIMRMVDTAAGLSAHKHCRGRVVTVAMDEMSFLEPIFLGEVVTVKAMVNDVGRTSMEVGVRVEAENYYSGRKVHSSSAYLVFVALDERGKPRPVPPLAVETEEEQRRQREAKLRREARLAHAAAIKSVRGEAPDP